MPVVDLKAELDKNDLIKIANQLETVELDEFIRDMIRIRANRKTDPKLQKEEELLLIINHNFSKKEQERFDELVTMRQTNNISDEDLMELIALTDYSEQIATERVNALTQLSKIKGVGVSALMKELKVQPHNYE